MGKLTVIPATKSITPSSSQSSAPLLCVAAYCRVSTDYEEQASSFETQVEHYTSYINSKPEWTLAGIYADEGISGTDTKKRTEFNRMIKHCLAGEIDMIITKSISRFARNTLDCLHYIRMLKDHNIPVFFEKEGINTMDSKGEVLLTIMASLAQQESQSLSKNVRMGLQYRYQRGEVQINHNWFLGYTKDENGKLIVVPEQAEVVRRIYREYLAGYSTNRIAAELERDGVLTGAGKKKWHTSTILKILSNEKYIGDALLQKSYVKDFLTKKRELNTGQMPQYYIEDDHEPIISREVFALVQEEMAKRRNEFKTRNGRKKFYSRVHCFSGKVICSECDAVYRRIYWYLKGGKVTVWRCLNRLEKHGVKCCSRTVYEDELMEKAVLAVKQVFNDDESAQRVLDNEMTVCGSHRIADEGGKLEMVKDDKQIVDSIVLGNLQTLSKRIREGDETVFDDKLFRRLIEKIVVYNDVLEFWFTCGERIYL